MSYTSAFQGNYIDSQVGKDIATQSDINNIWKTIYPVGAVYISFAATSPQTLFGGTWEQIQGAYLYPLVNSEGLAAGTSFGNWYHTHIAVGTSLTVDQMPSHTHIQDAHWHQVHSRVNSNGSSNGSVFEIANWSGSASGSYNYSLSTQSVINSPGYNGGAVVGATTTTATNQSTGNGATHTHTIQEGGNYPPSIRVYMWRRTA